MENGEGLENRAQFGQSWKVALQLSGHKSETAFNYYHTVETSDLEKALRVAGELNRAAEK